MHKRKETIRDIYQGENQDFEKDFTPQVAKEITQERQRDARRSQLLSFFLWGLVALLTIALVAVVIYDFLPTSNIAPELPSEDTTYIPRHTLPTDATWVMEYQNAVSTMDEQDTPGPKPFSTKWVKNAAYHIIMGQQALAIQAPDEALTHFSRVVEIYPDMQGLHRVMGMLYLQREEFALAADHLEKALAEKEEFDVLNNLGTAYIGTEAYETAEKHLQRALELQPENPGCHKNLAILYRKMEQDDKAVFHFEKYIDLRPSDLDTMQTYALYLTKLGRWEEAASFLTTLTQDVTNVAPIYFLLAQVQVQNGHEDQAIAALQRGIQLIDPDLALAWMSRQEFNNVRNSGKFKGLVDQLEISKVSLEDTE